MNFAAVLNIALDKHAAEKESQERYFFRSAVMPHWHAVQRGRDHVATS